MSDLKIVKQTNNKNEVEDEIRGTAELIFEFLYRNGEMELETLRENVSHRMPYFDWGLGWLVGKGDIEIHSHKGVFGVCRRSPTPVVIPLRGN